MLFVGVKVLALHVLGDLVYGACAVRSLKYVPVSFGTSAHLLSLRTSEWISMNLMPVLVYVAHL
jgi:hypothetical protein